MSLVDGIRQTLHCTAALRSVRRSAAAPLPVSLPPLAASSPPPSSGTLAVCPWVSGGHREADTPITDRLLFLSESPRGRACLTLAPPCTAAQATRAPGLRRALFCPRPIPSTGTSCPRDCQRHSPGPSHLDKGHVYLVCLPPDQFFCCTFSTRRPRVLLRGHSGKVTKALPWLPIPLGTRSRAVPRPRPVLRPHPLLAPTPPHLAATLPSAQAVSSDAEGEGVGVIPGLGTVRALRGALQGWLLTWWQRRGVRLGCRFRGPGVTVSGSESV